MEQNGRHSAGGWHVDRDIEVRADGEAMFCPACRAPALAWARVPHEMSNAAGETIAGLGIAVLCEHCDTADPGAAPLLTYLAVHEQVREEHCAEVVALLRRWALNAEARPPDPLIVEQELAQWRAGEL